MTRKALGKHLFCAKWPPAVKTEDVAIPSGRTDEPLHGVYDGHIHYSVNPLRQRQQSQYENLPIPRSANQGEVDCSGRDNFSTD